MNRPINFNPVMCVKWYSAEQLKILHHVFGKGQQEQQLLFSDKGHQSICRVYL